jgi:hypothetical protein
MTRKDKIICVILLLVLLTCGAIYSWTDRSLALHRFLGIVAILCWISIVYIRRLKPGCSKSSKKHDDHVA